MHQRDEGTRSRPAFTLPIRFRRHSCYRLRDALLRSRVWRFYHGPRGEFAACGQKRAKVVMVDEFSTRRHIPCKTIRII